MRPGLPGSIRASIGSLNHALGGTIKPLRLVEANTNIGSSYFGTCCWSSPSKMSQSD